MKASKLIEELQKLIDEYGDCFVIDDYLFEAVDQVLHQDGYIVLSSGY